MSTSQIGFVRISINFLLVHRLQSVIEKMDPQSSRLKRCIFELFWIK